MKLIYTLEICLRGFIDYKQIHNLSSKFFNVFKIWLELQNIGLHTTFQKRKLKVVNDYYLSMRELNLNVLHVDLFQWSNEKNRFLVVFFFFNLCFTHHISHTCIYTSQFDCFSSGSCLEVYVINWLLRSPHFFMVSFLWSLK